MTFIKNMLFGLLILLVFVIALLASADNSDEVALKFLEFESPVWPISWWILLAFVMGTLFGVLLNIVSNTRLRLDARAANKTASGRTRELDHIKASPGVS